MDGALELRRPIWPPAQYLIPALASARFGRPQPLPPAHAPLGPADDLAPLRLLALTPRRPTPRRPAAARPVTAAAAASPCRGGGALRWVAGRQGMRGWLGCSPDRQACVEAREAVWRSACCVSSSAAAWRDALWWCRVHCGCQWYQCFSVFSQLCFHEDY